MAFAFYYIFCFQCRTDSTGFTRMRMHVDPGIWNTAFDVVYLCFQGCLVVLCSALEDEMVPEHGKIGCLYHILPDIFREYLRDACKKFFLCVTLFLEVNPVRVKKDGTAIVEAGCLFCRKSNIGKALNRYTELFGHTLQQGTVTGRTLVGETEVLHHAVLHEKYFDVLPSDIADDIDALSAGSLGRFHMGDGLYDIGIGTECSFEDIGGVAGHTKPLDIIIAFRVSLFDLLQQFEGIFYGISLAELVDFEKQFSCFIDQYRFGRGGASVYTQETGGLSGQFWRCECFYGIFFFKYIKLFRTLHKRGVNIVIFVDTTCVNQCFQRDETGE